MSENAGIPDSDTPAVAKAGAPDRNNEQNTPGVRNGSADQRSIPVPNKERDLFAKYVELANAGARAIGFKDVGSIWKSGYGMPEADFAASVDKLWGQVKPLYDQLHCYTRRKLNQVYSR